MHAAGPKNPLHGITLEKLLTELVDHYGWDMLGRMIQINCFTFHPSIKSSLIFLRRTPWARAKVEQLYIDSLPDMTPEARAAVEAAEAADREELANFAEGAEAEGPEEAAEAVELAKATEAAEGGITPDEDEAPRGEEAETPAAAAEAAAPAKDEGPEAAIEAVELAKATEAAEGGITPDEDEERPAP